VRLGEVVELHAAFLDESRTRGRWLEQRTGNPGISLVFREMWDSTDLNPSFPGPKHRYRDGTGAPGSPQRTWAEKDRPKAVNGFQPKAPQLLIQRKPVSLLLLNPPKGDRP
jgi:hypothetical protein